MISLSKTAQKTLALKNRQKAVLAEKNRLLKESNLELNRTVRDLAREGRRLELENQQLLKLLDQVRRSYPTDWSSPLLNKIRKVFIKEKDLAEVFADEAKNP